MEKTREQLSSEYANACANHSDRVFQIKRLQAEIETLENKADQAFEVLVAFDANQTQKPLTDFPSKFRKMKAVK